jgi:hypothetical protein
MLNNYFSLKSILKYFQINQSKFKLKKNESKIQSEEQNLF